MATRLGVYISQYTRTRTERNAGIEHNLRSIAVVRHSVSPHPFHLNRRIDGVVGDGPSHCPSARGIVIVRSSEPNHAGLSPLAGQGDSAPASTLLGAFTGIPAYVGRVESQTIYAFGCNSMAATTDTG